jgi:hypothetical protein
LLDIRLEKQRTQLAPAAQRAVSCKIYCSLLGDVLRNMLFAGPPEPWLFCAGAHGWRFSWRMLAQDSFKW